jgi:hypothetical protein
VEGGHFRPLAFALIVWPALALRFRGSLVAEPGKIIVERSLRISLGLTSNTARRMKHLRRALQRSPDSSIDRWIAAKQPVPPCRRDKVPPKCS